MEGSTVSDGLSRASLGGNTSNSKIIVKAAMSSHGDNLISQRNECADERGSKLSWSAKQDTVKGTDKNCSLPVPKNIPRSTGSGGTKSCGAVYVVQDGMLVQLASASSGASHNQEKRSSVRIVKEPKVESTLQNNKEKVVFSPGKRSTGNQAGKRTAIYTPGNVRTVSVGEKTNKDSSKLEFIVYENAENNLGEGHHTAGKRLSSDHHRGPKKKRVRISASSDAVTNKVVTVKNSSSGGRGSEKIGNRICRIKVEPPQLSENLSPSGHEDLTAVVSIDSGVCKSEPVIEGWQELEEGDLDETALFGHKSIVISVQDGLSVKSSGEGDIVDKDHTPQSHKESSSVSADTSHKSQILKKVDPTKGLFFQCENCGYSSKYKTSVKRHKEHCGIENSCTKRSCIFPNCQVKFYHVSQMIRHMEVMHSACIGVKNLKFASVDEFHVWKEKEEITHFTYFTKHRGDCQTKNGLYSIYICQNDGSNKSHRRKDEPPRLTGRRYKKGTIKTGSTCPSRMFVTKYQGEVTVKYFYSHNHELKFENTQFHPIARKSLDYIKSRFSVGASPKQVQDELRNKAVFREKVGGEVVKGQLISLRTLNTIKHEYLSSFRLDKDDANSVFLLVKEWEKKEFNPVMLYKPQYCTIVIGNCNKYFPSQSDIFFIALQTEAQFKCLNSATNCFLCIDTTYFSGRHGFYLLSLIIHDASRKGVPVAYFISNCRTEEIIRYFFYSVKERCPNLSVHGVMTDADFSGWEAFLAVFGYVSVHVVCQWHIKRTWKKKVDSMVDSDSQKEVMNNLTAMMQERDEHSLSKLMGNFKLKYENIHPKFVEYFQSNIVSQPELWALCLRDLSSCNSVADMYCKGFHDTLEVFFTKTKAKKRIDDLLLLLLRIEETDNEQRLSQEESSHNAKSTVPQIGNHAKSLDIADADVSESDGRWKVVCQGDRSKSFQVTKLRDECLEDFCTAECQDLPCGNLCSHMYKCSCGDNSGLCEHIHKVHSGKSNIIIICSLDSHSVVVPEEKQEVVLYEDPLEIKVKQEKSLLNAAYDNLGQLNSYIGHPNVQQELLPQIVETLEQLVLKCREVSRSLDDP